MCGRGRCRLSRNDELANGIVVAAGAGELPGCDAGPGIVEFTVKVETGRSGELGARDRARGRVVDGPGQAEVHRAGRETDVQRSGAFAKRVGAGEVSVFAAEISGPAGRHLGAGRGRQAAEGLAGYIVTQPCV